MTESVSFLRENHRFIGVILSFYSACELTSLSKPALNEPAKDGLSCQLPGRSRSSGAFGNVSFTSATSSGVSSGSAAWGTRKREKKAKEREKEKEKEKESAPDSIIITTILCARGGRYE